MVKDRFGSIDNVRLGERSISHVYVGDHLVFNKVDIFNGHEYVDLGLPSGLLWATCNVGAHSPEGYGLLFQWGAVTGCDAENPTPALWENAPFNNGASDFNETYFMAHKDMWLDADNRLKRAYDAASVNMGGAWRMPTKEDFEELRANTTNKNISDYNHSGVRGVEFTSKINGNTLFIPDAGYGDEEGENGFFNSGFFIWSSTWDEDDYSYDFTNGLWLTFDSMYYAQSVRGVISK